MKKNPLDLNARNQKILNKIDKKITSKISINNQKIYQKVIDKNKQKILIDPLKVQQIKKIKKYEKENSQIKIKINKEYVINQEIYQGITKKGKAMKLKNIKNKIILKNKPKKYIKNKGRNILKQILNCYPSNVLIQDKKPLEINTNTLKSTNKKYKKSINKIKQFDLTLQDHSIKIENNQSQIKKSKSKSKEIKYKKIKDKKVTPLKLKQKTKKYKKSIQMPIIQNQVNQSVIVSVPVPKKIGRPKKVQPPQNQQVKEINLNDRKILEQVLQKTIKLCKIKNQKQFYELFGRIKMYLKESYFYGDLATKLAYQPTSQQLEQLGVIISKNIRIQQQVTSMNNNLININGVNSQVYAVNGTI